MVDFIGLGAKDQVASLTADLAGRIFGALYNCFALIAGAFCVILFRALMMSPSEVKRIAGLPLDSSESEETAGDSFTPEK